MLSVEGCIDYLRVHGHDVSKAHRAGDPAATAVVDVYRLIYDCPSDMAAGALLVERIHEWRRKAEEVADG